MSAADVKQMMDDDDILNTPREDPDPTEELAEDPEYVAASVDAVALHRLKEETLKELRSLYISGKGPFVRQLLAKHGHGALVFPEVEAKHFPAIKADLDRGSAQLMTFDGGTFSENLDGDRLRVQLHAVWVFMFDERWHTLHEVSVAIGAPEASVSARLRDFRKPKFGGHIVERQRVPNGNGLHIYRLRKRSQTPMTDHADAEFEELFGYD